MFFDINSMCQENMNSYCRTCLKELKLEIAVDIYKTPNLVKWLVVCTAIDYEKSDEYPNQICQACHLKMRMAYEFRVMCNKSMRKLEKIINSSPKNETDQLNLNPGSNELDDPRWLYLAETLDCGEQEQENGNISLADDFSNVVKYYDHAQSIVLEEQEIDHNDIFRGLPNYQSDSESAPEKNVLDDIEDSLKRKVFKSPVCPRDRKLKNDDYTMPAYIKTPEIYKCEKCMKKFFKRDRFEAHSRLHEGLKPYPCRLCDKSYNKSSHLKVHMVDIHTEHKDEFKCESEGCDKVFRRKQTLRVHCRNKHSEVKCEPKMFICEECGKTFRNIGALKDHRFKHTGEDFPYKCEQCGKGYISQRTYRDHLMRHAGIKNFVCPYCGLRKTTKSELRIHINYHTKEKQWPCPSCPQVFNSSANLGLHNRIVHKGIRRFKCRFCEQSFGKAETLKHHEMRHTGEKPHQCTTCGKRFIQVVALRAHLKTHNK